MNSLPIPANFTSYLAEAAPATWDIGSIEKWPLEFGGEAAPQTSGVVDAAGAGSAPISQRLFDKASAAVAAIE